jgi:ribosomal protein L29
MSETPKTPLPDYFELLGAMTGGAPAAGGFSGLGGMPGFGAHSGAAFGLPAMNPEEFDKKIREFEVVLMWLRGQAAAVELSIKTMEYQRDTLRQMGAARESAGNAFSSEDMAKYAAAFNPSAWMAQMMPSAPSDSDAAGNKRSSPPGRTKSGAKPSAAKKSKP